ncbi:RNA ligase family protein [Thiofilum flexile]|uniref:RNA ligase family protein n=1 Tax=Thiofilum flexile TaxID=125627 RepID=UPI00037CB6AC|nr:RNA ligase family protein [Thiofilum flexile]
MSVYKYPRTPHLPWSASVASDDIRIINTQQFVGLEVVVTEKMDGENTSLYRDRMHARSIDSRHHDSRDWVKQWYGQFKHEIPPDWRICGENLYAQHSVIYPALESYFYGFSIWNEQNICLSWADTQDWFGLLNIHLPPVLYQGIWDEELIRAIPVDTQRSEGYVVRATRAFHYDEFAQHMAKWVRAKHVQTTEHWMFAEIIPNGLKEGAE